MENIVEPNIDFDFSALSLAQPTGIQGGAYFTKIQNKGKSLYVQTPKSTSKQGFIRNGKKINIDLMFESNATDSSFLQWLENLELRCHQLIFEKGNQWFQNNLEKSDIETAFLSPMKLYKSGKYYILHVNTKVNTVTNAPIIKIYNEKEETVALDDIYPETNVVSILEIQGIKFTSRNFQIEMELKQMMTLNTDILFENCVIKPNASSVSVLEPVLEPVPEPVLEPVPEPVLEPVLAKKEFLESLCDEIIEAEKDIQEDDEDTEEEELPPLKIGESIFTNDALEEIKMNTTEDDTNILQEVHLEPDDVEDAITLKKPNHVYYEIYKQARRKAREAKKEAIMAFLEARNIKKTYLLEDDSESDSESDFDIDSDIQSEFSEAEKEAFRI